MTITFVLLSDDAAQLSMIVIILITSMDGWTKRENCNSSSYIESPYAWHANSPVIDFRYPRLSFGTLQLLAVTTISRCDEWSLSCYSLLFCKQI